MYVVFGFYDKLNDDDDYVCKTRVTNDTQNPTINKVTNTNVTNIE